MAKRTCSIEDCGGTVRARGWCAKHYQRWHKHGSPDVVLRNADVAAECSIDGCTKTPASRGYCDKHYWRGLRNGMPASPQRHARVRGRADVGGPVTEQDKQPDRDDHVIAVHDSTHEQETKT